MAGGEEGKIWQCIESEIEPSEEEEWNHGEHPTHHSRKPQVKDYL